MGGGVSVHIWHIKSRVKNTLETHWKKKGEAGFITVFCSAHLTVSIEEHSGTLYHQVVAIYFYPDHYTPSVSGLSCDFQPRNTSWWMDHAILNNMLPINLLLFPSWTQTVLANTLKAQSLKALSWHLSNMWNHSTVIIQVACLSLSPPGLYCFMFICLFLTPGLCFLIQTTSMSHLLPRVDN